MVSGSKGRKKLLTMSTFQRRVSSSISEDTIGKSPISCWGGANFIGYGCRQPLIFPNMYHLTVSNPPPNTPINNFQTIIDASPSIRGIATKLCTQNITIGEVLGLVNPSNQRVWVDHDSPHLLC